MIAPNMSYSSVAPSAESSHESNGEIALITGASRGLGAALARVLAFEGWSVIGACRNPEQAARAQASAFGSSDDARRAFSRIQYIELDLASFDSVRFAAQHILDTTGHIDLLVNNAGISRGLGASSADGFELTMQTNFLSPFLLTNILCPCLLASSAPAVVCITSAVQSISGWNAVFSRLGRDRATRPASNGVLGGLWYYAASKFALSAFCLELASRNDGKRLSVAAVHPGVIDTGIMYGGAWYDRPIRRLLKPFFIDIDKAVSGIRSAVALLESSARVKDEDPSNAVYFASGTLSKFPKRLCDPEKRKVLWDLAAAQAGLDKNGAQF